MQKRARKLGLLRAIRNSDEGQKFSKQYMALALLPTKKIGETAAAIYTAADDDMKTDIPRLQWVLQSAVAATETP